MKQKIIVWILIMVLSIQLVMALGVRPARTNLAVDDYSEDNIKIEGKIWVVNNEQRELTVNLYEEGELAEFVKIKTDPKKLTFRSEDDAKD